MTIELTLNVTDLEKKAIAFCREKDVPYPIGKYLVKFAEEVTKELQEENAKLKKNIEKMKCCENCQYRYCNKTSQYQKCWYCKNKNKWKLAE